MSLRRRPWTIWIHHHRLFQFSVAVERVFPWWEAAEAYERAAAGGARGKLLLDFTANRQWKGHAEWLCLCLFLPWRNQSGGLLLAVVASVTNLWIEHNRPFYTRHVFVKKKKWQMFLFAVNCTFLLYLQLCVNYIGWVSIINQIVFASLLVFSMTRTL